MNGIILIDKPQDWTSHDVVNKVRRWAREQSENRKIKVGHAGTLDPLATGVLPICIGRATKFVDNIGGMSKQYKATFRLGVVTDTQDISGQIINNNAECRNDLAEIENAIKSFVGEIEQVPPMYSAIKVNGEKLYDLARKGIEIERKSRKITIHNIEILDISLPDITILVDCSKGTYIRTLCHDIGQKLSSGATLTALTRTKVGCFNIEECQEIINNNAECRNYSFVPTSICIGTFDGVHQGHQELVKLARKQDHKTIALVIEPENNKGQQLTTAKEKEEKLCQAGADIVIPAPLKSIRNLPPEDFFEEYIVRRLNAKCVSVGFNFQFGFKKEGNIDTLQKLCDKENIELRILLPVMVDGEIISSTRIKERKNG